MARPLKCVIQGDGPDDEVVWRVGVNGITDIRLIPDGKGPTGFYDMIYLFRGPGTAPHAAMPAHHCTFWEFMDAKPEPEDGG